VDGREGQNYLWTAAQMGEVLGSADAEWAAKVYMLDKGPNFRDPHHPGEAASNVLRLADHPGAVAASLGLSKGAFHTRLITHQSETPLGTRQAQAALGLTTRFSLRGTG